MASFLSFQYSRSGCFEYQLKTIQPYSWPNAFGTQRKSEDSWRYLHDRKVPPKNIQYNYFNQIKCKQTLKNFCKRTGLAMHYSHIFDATDRHGSCSSEGAEGNDRSRGQTH